MVCPAEFMEASNTTWPFSAQTGKIKIKNPSKNADIYNIIQEVYFEIFIFKK